MMLQFQFNDRVALSSCNRRYFSDNPGDRAVHAEAVLGYPMTEIRRLLLGSLGHYLKKTDTGGWECHPWVEQVLSALYEKH